MDNMSTDTVNYLNTELPVDTTQPGAEKYSDIVGVFRERTHAEEAINALKQAGIGGDTIQLTEYNPDGDAAPEANVAEEGIDALLLSSGVSDPRRILVHVRAEGREQEAVALLISCGANNGDLPPGTALVEGSIVDTGDDASKHPTSIGASESFGSAQVQARPSDVNITDSPKPPSP